MKTLEQQRRRQIFCLSTPPEAEVRTKAAALTHYPDTNLIQDPEPLTRRKGSINLPVLVQKELDVLRSGGEETSHFSLPFANPRDLDACPVAHNST